MTHTYTAGGVVLNAKGKILIANKLNRAFTFPKGHIDPGEDALTATKREIYEETGVTDLTLVRELGTYDRYRISKDGGDDLNKLKTITMFLFTTNQMKLQPVDPDHPDARWVSKEEVASLLTHRKDKEFFLSILPSL